MKLHFCLIDADYIEENGKAVVRLWGKTAEGESILVLDENFQPYFYALPSEGKVEEAKKKILARMEKEKELKILKIETVEKIFGSEKRKFLKIFCDIPQNIPKVRDIVKLLEDGLVVEEYEYSINFYRRWLIDHSISGMDWIEVEGPEEHASEYVTDIVLKANRIKKFNRSDIPELKLLAFDIESFEEGGKSKIIMISLVGKGFKKVLTYEKDKYQNYVEVLKDEKELLEAFVREVQKFNPDIIVGYNSDEFDFNLIQQRCDELRSKLLLARDGSWLRFSRRARISAARFTGRLHIDLFPFINTILGPSLQTETMSLDAVAGELLGDHKIELEFEELLEMWRKKKDLGKLAEYNLKDSELTLRLAEFLLPQIFQLSKLVGQLPFDTDRMMYSQLVEWYMSRRAVELGCIIPNQPKWDEIEKRRMRGQYVGGFVKEPIAGLHEEIAVLDFRSLYPSIIASFNISPETFNCNCCEKTAERVPLEGKKFWFCKHAKGFFSGRVAELIEARAKIKAEMKKAKPGSAEFRKLNDEQFAHKTLANASYGYLPFAGSKWYCYECGESAAAYGRYFIQKIMAEAGSSGFVVIYGDTDSFFMKLNKKNNLCAETEKFLAHVNKELPGIMELGLQGFYKRGIFIPRGIGPGTAKKRYALIDEKNNLTIRGLEKVRRDWSNVAKDTQEEVLKFVLQKEDVKGAVAYVKKIIEQLKNKKIPLRDLIIYEQLTKPLEQYKNISPHVVAARKIKERGRPYGPGMVVMFVITKKGKSISERAEPFEDVSVNDVDTDYYIEHQIVPAALRVLAVFGISEKEFVEKKVKKVRKEKK